MSEVQSCPGQLAACLFLHLIPMGKYYLLLFQTEPHFLKSPLTHPSGKGSREGLYTRAGESLLKLSQKCSREWGSVWKSSSERARSSWGGGRLRPPHLSASATLSKAPDGKWPCWTFHAPGTIPETKSEHFPAQQSPTCPVTDRAQRAEMEDGLGWRSSSAAGPPAFTRCLCPDVYRQCRRAVWTAPISDIAGIPGTQTTYGQQ